MKKIKIFSFLFILFSIFSPFFSTNAQNTTPECQYFPSDIACGGYNDTDATIERCAPIQASYKCCRNSQHPSFPPSFFAACNVGVWTVEEPDKSKCAVGKKCCCHTSALQQKPAATTATPPKFEIPQMQVEIPTVKLSKVTCTPDDKGNYDCQVPWIGEYIAGIYNYGLSIAGILAAIVLMAGGLLWLVSGGDASKITQAKDLILGAITGLIILMTSYILLIQINPELVKMKSISISSIKKLEALAESRNGGTAEGYKNGPCATDDELANGVDFYATGYYKPKWEDTDTFRCVIAMQCTCPNGQDETKNCDQLYGKTFPNYHPCKEFDEKTDYCNMTSSDTAPQDGDIAGPKNCTANLPAGTKVCFKGQTYTIRDTGGGILGKRIDIWSGDNLTKAYAVTGVGKLKKGACN